MWSRGRYDVASFFTPNGIYGRIQWWACNCYVITLAVQVPFLDRTFYVGPFVKSLGGAGISWIVGFALASLLCLAAMPGCYAWLLCLAAMPGWGEAL